MRERQDDDGHADPHARGARGHEGGEIHSVRTAPSAMG